MRLARPSQSVSDQRGFTLLELLVVLVLLGVIYSFMVLSGGTAGVDRELEEEARRLHALVKLAQEDAIIQAREIALEIDQQNVQQKYRFLVFTNNEWQPLTEKIFRERNLPETYKVIFHTEAEKLFAEEKDTPLRVYLLSTGEITPFDLDIQLRDDASHYYRLSGSLTGELTLKNPGELGSL